MKKAYGSSVNSIIAEFIDCKGIRMNWLGSMRTPMTADKSGSLNFLRKIGIFVGAKTPYKTEFWGIVGDIIG